MVPLQPGQNPVTLSYRFIECGAGHPGCLWHDRNVVPALPFCKIRLSAQKPRISSCPATLHTLGDHLRKRRLDLGLLQSAVARELGVAETTVYNWERDRAAPSIRCIPAIVKFLG